MAVSAIEEKCYSNLSPSAPGMTSHQAKHNFSYAKSRTNAAISPPPTFSDLA
jgi:hypothetical protein